MSEFCRDAQPVAALRGLSVVYDGVRVLGPLDFIVEPGQRWVILGPNGSGKTSLVRALTLHRFPSTGTIEVLGEQWGSTDIRELRTRVGVASAALREQLRPDLTACDVVMTAKYAALEPWWHTYTDDDRLRAVECLERLDCGHLGDRAIKTLSSGETQRVLLARTFMTDPGILVLDEPSAGLDLGGREQLVTTLADLAATHDTPPLVLVTHHTDEIPPGFTHAMLLRDGQAVATGTIDHVLTAPLLSETFDIDLTLERREGRWLAFASRPRRSAG